MQKKEMGINEPSPEEIKKASISEKEKMVREKRETDVKAYGFANTRKNKRASRKMYEESKKFFDACTKVFVDKYVAEGFDISSPEVTETIEKLNAQWREKARYIISKNSDHYNTSAKRLRFLASFVNFVESIVEKVSEHGNSQSL